MKTTQPLHAKASFSQVITTILRFCDDAHEGGAEIRAWGAPSECSQDHWNAREREASTLLQGLGWTDAEMQAEIQRRGIGARWCYEHLGMFEQLGGCSF